MTMTRFLKHRENKKVESFAGKIISETVDEKREQPATVRIETPIVHHDNEKFNVLIGKVVDGKATVNEKLELSTILFKRIAQD